jgi:hypothetical protein
VLISAAVCPHPPILVPELAGEAACELDGLRAACRTAISRLIGSDAQVVVVGGGPETRAFGSTGSGSLSGYGLAGTYGPDKPSMPLSLTIGRYLLAEFNPSAFQSIAFDATPEECLALGRSLAAQADRVALLVMGDGPASRDEKAPGYLDVRAGPYDQEVARALRDADAAALGTLDPVLAQELQVAGRAAWQVLAGGLAREFRHQEGRMRADGGGDQHWPVEQPDATGACWGTPIDGIPRETPAGALGWACLAAQASPARVLRTLRITPSASR